MCDDKEKSLEVSVRSLIDPQMAGRMFVQRGNYLNKIFIYNIKIKYNKKKYKYKILYHIFDIIKGDETGQWKSKYFVLMKKFSRLYCFDNEDVI